MRSLRRVQRKGADTGDLVFRESPLHGQKNYRTVSQYEGSVECEIKRKKAGSCRSLFFGFRGG